MYVPNHFALTTEQVTELIQTRGAGDLVTMDDSGFQATFLPFTYHPEVGEFGALRTHLSRVNPQWKTPGQALVIVHGPDHYISPVRENEQNTGVDRVPTWNYVTAHLYGEKGEVTRGFVACTPLSTSWIVI